MSKILMPINPIHVEKIMSGTKKYEYRKILPKKTNIDTMLIYSTSPIKKVIGEAEILEIIIDNKEIVWNKTKDNSGINKEFYDKYYQNKDFAVAYKLGKIKKYDNPKDLKEFNINYYPQSFVYIDE